MIIATMKQTESVKAVMIVGGYGVVGTQIAELFNQRNPDIPLIIAGRNKQRAQALAANLCNASAAVINVDTPGQLTPMTNRLAVIITAVNDPRNFILSDAIEYGIPYIDIARWTARVRDATVLATIAKPRQPIIFASAWMAGVAAMVAKKACESFASVEKIDIDILYSLTDKAGPNSVEYIDQLGSPFEVMQEGSLKSVMPMTNPKALVFPGGFKAKTFRFDTPDQLSLPISCKAKSVSARIAYDDNFSAALLSFLVRSGIWNVLNRPMFTKLRRSLLYNPGDGGSHQIVINLTGIGGKGQARQVRSSIVDKQGQTHLTALGGVIQLERILGLYGGAPVGAGVWFPEQHSDIDSALQLLIDNGVEIEFSADKPSVQQKHLENA